MANDFTMIRGGQPKTVGAADEIDYSKVGAALDGMGRPLVEGDGVFLSLRAPGLYRVLGITPVLDPNQPPGRLHVHLAHFETLTVERGRAVGAIMRVGTAVECPPMPIRLEGVTPAEETPSEETH